MAESDDSTSDSVSTSRKQAGKHRTRQAQADPAGNIIHFEPDRPRGTRAESSLEVERQHDTKKAKARTRARASDREQRGGLIPDSVRERFIQIGNNFFFPDGAEAFTDYGNRVTTRSENAVVIQSMVAIARARAQGVVTVSGTEFFKREAWFAARLVGLEVRGYEPTALEHERLVRALARRRTAEQDDERAPPADRDASRSSKHKPELDSSVSASARRERRFREGELITGRLVDHGPARFEHKPNEQMSYYVRIETGRGDVDLWGVDLERAFRQSLSRPGIGDEVGLRVVGRNAVTVLAPKYDREGREIGREERAAHRNQWIVERRDFLEQRRKMAELFRDPSVRPAEAIRQFPELEGSYLQLQVARAGAESRIASSEAREQFVAHLRSHLARTIEYGQPLEPVHLRAREIAAEQQKEKILNRDYQPTR